MPLSKERNKKRMQALRRLNVKSIMSSASVRAMRAAGLRPEDIEPEAGKVSSSIYYALLRDRDAIKAHLSWHHEAVRIPDVGTVIEGLQGQVAKMQAQIDGQATRIIQLEAGQVLHEAQETYQSEGRGSTW